MFHFIFDYNYANFWQISIIILPLKHEWILYQCVETVSLQPDYVSTLSGKTKNNTKTVDRLCSHSVEPIVPNFCRKSFNVRFFSCLLEYSFSSLLAENLWHSYGFYQKCSSNAIWLILSCELRLNWREIWRVTVMTSSSY